MVGPLLLLGWVCVTLAAGPRACAEDLAPVGRGLMDIIARTKSDLVTPASLSKKTRGGHAREMDRIVYVRDMHSRIAGLIGNCIFEWGAQVRAGQARAVDARRGDGVCVCVLCL